MDGSARASASDRRDCHRDLPVAVRLLFGAHDKDAMLFSHVFAPGAIVTDRERLFKGIVSIVAWQRDFETRYPAHSFEPLRLARSARNVVAHMRVRGEFPGSPRKLSYRIELRDHRIVAMRVSEVR
ncbi:nuclear transport factor 2 family protein [Noviluteimonas dokdonensis]|uniref:nuclear transport factor 2 family protein n=1 Tax=Noviluteimonas dokdonensis TaxID=414050 RepID=UPI00126A162F|nr:nuclear transport factor 2 family protein [Lysobacter dokdonensis]